MEKSFAIDVPLKIEIEDSSEEYELPKHACRFLLTVMRHANASVNMDVARNALDRADRIGYEGFRSVEPNTRLFLRDDIDLPGLLYQVRRHFDKLFEERDDKLFVDEKNARTASELDHCLILIKVLSRAIMYGRSINIVYNKPHA